MQKKQKKMKIEKVVVIVDNSLHTAIFKAYLGIEKEWYDILAALFKVDAAEFMKYERQYEGDGPCFVTGVGYQENGIYEKVNAICWGGQQFIIGDDASLVGNTLIIQNVAIYAYNDDLGRTEQLHWEEIISLDLSNSAAQQIGKVVSEWMEFCEFGLDDKDEEFFRLKSKSGKLPKSFELADTNLWTEGLTDWDELEELSKFWPLRAEFGVAENSADEDED